MKNNLRPFPISCTQFRTELSANDPYHDVTEDLYTRDLANLDHGVCTSCGVQYRGGKFEWYHGGIAGLKEIICPACKRSETRAIGAVTSLHGEFLIKHKADILRLVRETEIIERALHPLQRIIEIDEQGAGIQIATTYEQLARRIAERIHSACGGSLQSSRSPGDGLLHMDWSWEGTK